MDNIPISSDSSHSVQYCTLYIVKSLQDRLENEYQEKLQTARELYDQRFNSLSCFPQQFYDSINHDQILGAMKENPVTRLYTNERIQEIYEDLMLKEKEQEISRLQEEILFKNNQAVESQKTNTELQCQIRALTDDLISVKERIKLLEGGLSEPPSPTMKLDHQDRCKRADSSQPEESRHSAYERQLKKTIQEVEGYIQTPILQIEKTEGGYQYEKKNPYSNESRRSHKESIREQEDLDSQTDMLSYSISNATFAEGDTNERVPSTPTLLEKKILEQKVLLREQDQTIRNYARTIEQQRKQLEDTHKIVQDDLRKVENQWEKRCKDIQSHSHNKKAKLNEKHENQIQELRTYYHQLLSENSAELCLDSTHNVLSSQSAIYSRANPINLQTVTSSEKLPTSHLQAEIQRLNQKIEFLTEKNSELEILNMTRTGVSTQSRDTDGLEYFANRSKLRQTEGRAKQLSEDLNFYEQKSKKLKTKLCRAETENLELNNRLFAYQNELSREKSEITALQKQLTSKLSFACRPAPASLLRLKLGDLRNDLDSLKVFLTNELLSTRKKLTSNLQNLFIESKQFQQTTRNNYETKLSTVSDELNSQWSTKLNEIEDNLELSHEQSLFQYKGHIHSQANQIQELKQSLFTLKTDIQDYHEENQKLSRNNTALKETIEALQDEKKSFSQKLNKRGSEYEATLEEFRQESGKIRQTTERALDTALQEHKLKYEHDTKHLTQQLQASQAESKEKVESLENDIKLLHSQHEQETSSVKTRYHSLLDKAYLEQDAATETIATQRQKIKVLENEVGSLNSTIKKLNSSVESMKKSDDDRSFHSQEQYSSELEHLKQKIKGLQQELHFKDEELSTHSKERAKLKGNVQKLQEKNDLQTHKFHSKLSLQDRELSQLKDILGTSYSNSLDQVKMARELESETQLLSQKAKTPHKSRTSAFS